MEIYHLANGDCIDMDGVKYCSILQHWDPYSFILLNLFFSTQAAYAAPIIMMAQNRQSQRDRIQADNNYLTNVDA